MVSLTDIRAALERIRDSIYLSPAPQSETLSRATGNALCLKLENLQATGLFKERGALNRILTMSDRERGRGPITASAGNHGPAVTYHAAKRGIRAQICMPVFTPIVKVSAVTGFGGEVVLHGENFEETLQEALRRAQSQGFTFVHAFDDDAVIAGRLGVRETVVRRMLDPDTETRSEKLQAALVCLGQTHRVSVEDAA